MPAWRSGFALRSRPCLSCLLLSASLAEKPDTASSLLAPCPQATPSSPRSPPNRATNLRWIWVKATLSMTAVAEPELLNTRLSPEVKAPCGRSGRARRSAVVIAAAAVRQSRKHPAWAASSRISLTPRPLPLSASVYHHFYRVKTRCDFHD